MTVEGMGNFFTDLNINSTNAESMMVFYILKFPSITTISKQDVLSCLRNNEASNVDMLKPFI